MGDHIIYWVESLMAMPLFYPLVSLFVFLDALIPLVPSETVLNASGAWGATSDNPDLVYVFWFAMLGGVIGDNVCYLAGRKLHRYVSRIRPESKPGQAIRWVRKNMKRHAGATIVIARFIPWGRWATTILLGSVKFPWWMFFFYDTIGMVVWACIGIGVGYAGGLVFQDYPLLALIAGLLAGTAVGVVIQRIQNYFAARRDERRGYAEA